MDDYRSLQSFMELAYVYQADNGQACLREMVKWRRHLQDIHVIEQLRGNKQTNDLQY